jgi:hypothetical protein
LGFSHPSPLDPFIFLYTRHHDARSLITTTRTDIYLAFLAFPFFLFPPLPHSSTPPRPPSPPPSPNADEALRFLPRPSPRRSSITLHPCPSLRRALHHQAFPLAIQLRHARRESFSGSDGGALVGSPTSSTCRWIGVGAEGKGGFGSVSMLMLYDLERQREGVKSLVVAGFANRTEAEVVGKERVIVQRFYIENVRKGKGQINGRGQGPLREKHTQRKPTRPLVPAADQTRRRDTGLAFMTATHTPSAD